MAVIAILAVIAAASIGRFCTGTFETCSAEGVAHRVAVDLLQTRRRTIATGDNHYLAVATSGGKVVSYTMTRRASGGDAVVDQTRTIPVGVTVTASHAALEYDFEGATLAAYAITVAGPSRTWTVTTTMATGAVTTSVSP